MKRLTDYTWPGNIRELQNAISYAVVMSNSRKIGVDDLPPEVISKTPFPHIKYGMSIAEMEKALIKLTIERHAENRMESAKVLGISL